MCNLGVAVVTRSLLKFDGHDKDYYLVILPMTDKLEKNKSVRSTELVHVATVSVEGLCRSVVSFTEW
jgi:hypothetical protein